MKTKTGIALKASRRLVTIGAAGVALVFAVSACSSGGDGGSNDGSTLTLQTWSLTPKFTDYLNGVIESFEKENPGIKVKLLDQPSDGYSEKVLTQAASNDLPDVLNLPPDFALPLAQKGLLEDVSAHGDLSQTYVEGSVDAYRFAGLDGVYGYPWYLNTDLSWWNSADLDACGLDSTNPPATQQELFTQAKIMKEACSDKSLMSRKPGLSDIVLEGIPVFNKEGTEFIFNTSEAAALLDQYREAYADGLVPSTVLNNDYLGNSKLFTQNQVSWTTGGATAHTDFVTDNPSLEGKVVVSKALNSPPLWVQGMSVSKNSKNLPAAIALAEWVTNAENQNAFGHLVNVFPSTLESKEDPYFSESDGTVEGDARALAFDSLASAKVLTPYEVTPAMTDYFDQQVALAIRGDVTSQQALDRAVENMNKQLERQ
ncbi:extracellular solute-binding protein [Lysinibacter sp. HNR]|uniref:extracellular solute-binding protein n=1 Tax=Lysinibacter sp. HNR TaxID=3031408 RepID=UPI002434F1BC|nr:extracellular solute-binding protein [Lysinibacter sp. HNR]WGD37876.1 extracellular solute-binding protein [Lysinibacter sp. HNR]